MNPKIIYLPEWIEKILNGEKTMTIRKTQYPCGVYDVVSETEPDKVVCRIEIVKVEKWYADFWLSEVLKSDVELNSTPRFTEITGHTSGFPYNKYSIRTGQCEHSYEYYEIIELYPCWVCLSGFKCIADFIQYHRKNYAPVKFAHTFQLLKGESNA